jgi:membrane-bound lytic murein transglycosylase F
LVEQSDSLISIERNHFKISLYDSIVQQYAKKYNLDWLFVSAIIYQESRFNKDAIGKGGSFGLMQMMPITYDAFGIDTSATEEEQIRAGVEYLSKLAKRFKYVKNEKEILKFIAASYNAGIAHIEDAQRLAEKYESDPFWWEDVAFFLISKDEPEYINDSLVKIKRAANRYTVKYVENVMRKYEEYQKK